MRQRLRCATPPRRRCGGSCVERRCGAEKVASNTAVVVRGKLRRTLRWCGESCTGNSGGAAKVAASAAAVRGKLRLTPSRKLRRTPLWRGKGCVEHRRHAANVASSTAVVRRKLRRTPPRCGESCVERRCGAVNVARTPPWRGGSCVERCCGAAKFLSNTHRCVVRPRMRGGPLWRAGKVASHIAVVKLRRTPLWCGASCVEHRRLKAKVASNTAVVRQKLRRTPLRCGKSCASS